MGTTVSKIVREASHVSSSRQLPPPPPPPSRRKLVMRKIWNYCSSLEAPHLFDEIGSEASEVFESKVSNGVTFCVDTQPFSRLSVSHIIRVVDENEARQEAIAEAQSAGRDMMSYYFSLGAAQTQRPPRERYMCLAHAVPFDGVDLVFSIAENLNVVSALGVSYKGASAVIKNQFKMPNVLAPKDFIVELTAPSLPVRPRVVCNRTAGVFVVGGTATIYPGVYVGGETVFVKGERHYNVGASVPAFGGILTATHSPSFATGTAITYTHSITEAVVGALSFTRGAAGRTARFAVCRFGADGTCVRAAMSSRGGFCASFEELLGKTVKLTFKIDADFIRREYTYGVHMNIVL